MAAATRTAPSKNTDEYGIERVNADEEGFVGKMREKYEWFDHIMLTVDRYMSMGGNQYSAGITYFSVLSMFPLLMLVFAVAGFVLAGNPAAVLDIQEKVTESVDGQLADSINEIISTAIDQRGAIAGIGVLTALWSGLGWMNNLRYGVSKMWMVDPTSGNFLFKKLKDLIGLIGLLIAFAIAFGVTAIGNSGLTARLIEMAHLDGVPGIGVLVPIASIVIGLIANYCVFFWLILYLPRTKVPRKSAAKGALIGAVAFEIFKQIGSLFFSNALNNPAGATFGPIIGVMVLLYFVWRILLFTSAWTATTEESLAQIEIDAPSPAVIRVRNEITEAPSPTQSAAMIGVGAAAGAAGLAVIAKLFRGGGTT